MGGVLQKGESPKACLPETKLEAKILEAMQRRESEGSSMKSFNSIILKFPKIDENLRKCKDIFQEFGKYQNLCIAFLRLHLKVSHGCLHSNWRDYHVYLVGDCCHSKVWTKNWLLENIYFSKPDNYHLLIVNVHPSMMNKHKMVSVFLHWFMLLVICNWFGLLIPNNSASPRIFYLPNHPFLTN